MENMAGQTEAGREGGIVLVQPGKLYLRKCPAPRKTQTGEQSAKTSRAMSQPAY